MVENRVWWPNGSSVTWTWYYSDNPSGKTNTYGGWVWAKNYWDDIQNAWDGMEAIIDACEGTPVSGGIINAYPGGQYDWETLIMRWSGGMFSAILAPVRREV